MNGFGFQPSYHHLDDTGCECIIQRVCQRRREALISGDFHCEQTAIFPYNYDYEDYVAALSLVLYTYAVNKYIEASGKVIGVNFVSI